MTVAGQVAEHAEEAEQQGNRFPWNRRGKRATTAHAGESRLALMLIAPTILLLAVIVGYPIVKAIYSSFLSDPGLSGAFFNKGGQWVGLLNYKHWLLERCPGPAGTTVSCPNGNLGAQFWGSIGVTVGFTIVTVTLETCIGMGFALIMNKAFRGRAIVRAAILIPWAIPTAVTSKLWYVIFDPEGIANKMLHTHFQWLSSEWPARTAIVVADTWKTTPFIALLILAGLQGISSETYEAAMIDGANAWQRFWRITLPLVKPALAVAVIFRSLDVLRMFDLPWILTQGTNGTNTVSILVVKQLHSGINSASALSTITFIIIFAIALGLVRVFNANIVGAQTGGVK
jgi:ABC-type sugar transport system permease subunit